MFPLRPIIYLGALTSFCAAAALPADQLSFFEAKIRPVLVKHCYECHSAEADKVKGGLLLDTRDGIRAGGDSGPAVVPGEPAKSLLLAAISHTDPDLEMPPKKARLPQSVISDIEAWIKMGAPDPRDATGRIVERPPVDIKSGREFWSYKKPVQHTPPATGDPAWAKRDLDRFILSKLEENRLTPSPDAEPVTLLRRLYFDLIGLPPTHAVMTAFVQRARAGELDAALEAEVDALLKSERFGERWGRHWLDVARFAESSGRESNLAFPHAWRYRDYAIDALNADVPFDRFITEQIAGDLLPAKDDAERARLLIATGFLAFGTKGLNEMNRAQFDADVVDEQIDTVTRAVLGSSVACARCHDHKYDPFSMEDYYALAGIFGSTRTFFGTWIDSENNVGGDLIRLPDLPGQLIPNKSIPAKRVAELKAQLATLNAEEKAQEATVKKAFAEGRELGNEAFDLLRNALRIIWTRGGVEGQLKTVDDEGRALPLCMGVMENGKVSDARLLERGEIAHPGKTVARGFPRVIEADGIALPKQQSGRLEFARWLTSPSHPLTARVMANRIWRHLFGAGLVSTADNFGFTGERPSHPELLDHLALKFVDGDWSVKALVREVVLSRAYRLSSTYRADYFQKDPENRLLWRANKRRLDAEVIRDSMLAVAGQLDTSRRPGSLVAELDRQSMSLVGFDKRVPADLDGSRHRSIYLPVIRDRLPDVLDLFDFAEPSLVTGDREITNVPVQALYLMNSPFVQQQAAALARRIAHEQHSAPERIRRAFVICFHRPPDETEMRLADAYFQAAASDEEKAWTGYCQALLASAEFRNID
ncbi:MAG: PSD1 and planctomycete cytochrome C domain-containing protein [Chthoniobacteraceae bacterium]